MTNLFVIVLLKSNSVIGPFQSEASGIRFAQNNVEEQWVVRPVQSPEFS